MQKIFLFSVTLLVSSCISNVDKNSNQNLLNSSNEEKEISDSLRILNKNELFNFLDNPDLNIQNFREGLVEEDLYFGESWIDQKPFFLPKNTEVGCYALKYDRYKEFVQHPDARVNSSLLAQVYFYRPKTNTKWTIGDSTETIFSFKIVRPDINLLKLPRIGTKKKSLLNQLGAPDVDNDSIITYKNEKGIYTLQLDLYFKSDTLITLEYKKLKG